MYCSHFHVLSLMLKHCLSSSFQLLPRSLHHSSYFLLGNWIFKDFSHLPKGFTLSTKSTAGLFDMVNTLTFSQGWWVCVCRSTEEDVCVRELSLGTVVMFFRGLILPSFLPQSCKRIKRNYLSLQVDLWDVMAQFRKEYCRQ